jgi:hypothetical protein
MRSPISREITCFFVLATLVATNEVRAGLLSALDASVLIQSTASDTDAMFLSQFAGFQSGQTLNYNSSSTNTAWSGTLSDTSLNVNYSGDLSGYPSGAVTWSSSGTYRTENWSGSGNATIAETSSTTFQVSLVSSLALGGSTASINYVIPGTVSSDGTIMYDGEAGTGTVILNGTSFPNHIQFSYKNPPELDPFQIYSDIVGDIPTFPSLTNRYTGTFPIGGDIFLAGTITSVPEPSSWVLLGFGLLGWVPLRWWMRERKSPNASRRVYRASK